MNSLLRSFAACLWVAACLSCSGGQVTSPLGPGGTAGVKVDSAGIVQGVPDQSRDPAVVAIDVGGAETCTGTLIATNLVLTARHCVSVVDETMPCPSNGARVVSDRDPHTLTFYDGDSLASAREVARGSKLFVPQTTALCDDDIAAVVLDQDVAGLPPLAIAGSAPSIGDLVRDVGFATAMDGSIVKLLRDQAPIADLGPSILSVSESACFETLGGPTMNAQGDVIGVATRPLNKCDAPDAKNAYTRVDAFQNLINAALAAADASSSGGASDGGTGSGHHHGRHHKAPTDMGAMCTAGTQCSTGVCIVSSGAGYCSKNCGSTDRCPSHYKCDHTLQAQAVCVAK